MTTAPPVLPPAPTSNGAVHVELSREAESVAYKDSDAHALAAVVSVMLGILISGPSSRGARRETRVQV